MKARTKPASTPDDLAAARRVLEIEVEGIARFATSLGQEFADALDRLAAVTGRVVVTGIGKSGHIAHKIAATFASTGTPALFVHPAEASHGDLGMITPKDAVLALSNSGETPELAALIAYTRRFTIPLIAVTGRPQSALAEGSRCDAGVAGRRRRPARLGWHRRHRRRSCWHLGMRWRWRCSSVKDSRLDEFQVLHPGGQLGRNLLRVSDIMHTGEAIPLVGEKALMSDALIVMTTRSFGCIGILHDNDRLVGIITDGDLRRHMDNLLKKKAVDVMTANPRTIRPNALAAEALGYMNASKITSLFVVDDTRPVGILHIHDCLRAGVA